MERLQLQQPRSSAAAQAIVNEDDGAIIPMFANYDFATKDKVGTGEFATNWDMDGERWMERCG